MLCHPLVEPLQVFEDFFHGWCHWRTSRIGDYIEMPRVRTGTGDVHFT
jgi:hypothetical protein